MKERSSQAPNLQELSLDNWQMGTAPEITEWALQPWQVAERQNHQTPEWIVAPWAVAEEIPPPPPAQELLLLTQHFDTHWQEEGLPRDWYTLGNRTGFSMKKQMELLNDTDPASLSLWLKRTEMDIRGYCLEYLAKDRLLYPVTYHREVDKQTGRLRLVDQIYEKDITEMISADERNGSVRATLSNIKGFLLDRQTPVGSVCVMTSPKGPSGMTTDDGKSITYPDSYFFYFEKTDKEIINGFGLRTDYDHRECRDAIATLTGQLLPANATEEQHVRSFARILPSSANKPHSAAEFLHMLGRVRSADTENVRLYKDVSLLSAVTDEANARILYTFDKETNAFIEEFNEEVVTLSTESPNNRFAIQKALAATILRLSQLFIQREHWQEYAKQHGIQANDRNAQRAFQREHDHQGLSVSYGAALTTVAARGGCNSSGEDESLSTAALGTVSLVPRLMLPSLNESGSEESCPEIECTNCGWKPNTEELKAINKETLTVCPRCEWSPGKGMPPAKKDSQTASRKSLPPTLIHHRNPATHPEQYAQRQTRDKQQSKPDISEQVTSSVPSRAQIYPPPPRYQQHLPTPVKNTSLPQTKRQLPLQPASQRAK